MGLKMWPPLKLSEESKLDFEEESGEKGRIFELNLKEVLFLLLLCKLRFFGGGLKRSHEFE